MYIATLFSLAAKDCVCTGSRAHDPPCCWQGHSIVPNALEATPLRGWRSWQAFEHDVDQKIMEDTMRGLVRPRPELAGDFLSLAGAGYVDVGLDAGYEAVGKGYHGSCHDKSGHMLINKTRFPDFVAMNRVAHGLGLTSSWYLNSDECPGPKEVAAGSTYETDSADAVHYGFDGVKFDSQRGGPSHNITRWSMTLTAAARAAGKSEGMVIENCDDKNPTYLLDDPTNCPYNHYRTGPDNSPSFFGGLHHIFFWAVPYLRVLKPVPASRPHCWAYPDMLGIGAPVKGSYGWQTARANGCANMTLDEERTLFANWAIISSPLVLAFDTRDDAVVGKYWHIVTNQKALEINSAWAGSAGSLLKQSASGTNRWVPVGMRCEEDKYAVLPNWLIYTKLLPRGRVACLTINVGEKALDGRDGAEVSLSELLAIITASGSSRTAISTATPSSFTAVDVWTGKVRSSVSAARPWSAAGLSAHNSSFVVFSPV